MEDGEQTHPHVHFHDNPHVLFATTLATLVFAGSAYLWRSNKLFPRHLLQLRGEGGNAVFNCKPSLAISSPGENHGSNNISGKTASSGSQPGPSSRSADATAKEQKNARSKDRRRRGKDPAKEVLKSEKKLKSLLRSRPETSDGDTSLSAPFREHRSEGSQSSRDPSVSAPSRGELTPASSSRRPYPSQPDSMNGSSGITSFNEAHDIESTQSSSTPTLSPLPTSGPGRGTPPLDSSASVTTRSPLDSRESDLPSQEHDMACSIDSLSALSTTSHYSFASSSTSASSDSVKTPSTPLNIPLPENILTIPTDTHSLPSLPTCLSHHNAPATPVSSPRVARIPDSWDWDGSPQPFGSDSAFCKPPRFRSKSRGSHSSISSGASFSSGFPTMPTFTCHHSDNPTSDTNPPMSPMPSLSPDIDTRSSSSQSSVLCNSVDCATNLVQPHVPSASGEALPTSLPALAAQTQIASLKGALEAARVREDKMKADIEQYAKELEVIRWESMSWRHRELELKTQMQYLVQQLQGYAALYATLPMQTPLHPQLQLPVTSISAANINTNTSSLVQPGTSPFVNSSPAPVGLQSPTRMTSLNHGMTSPTNRPHSPFIGYPSYTTSPSHSQSPHHSNIFSLFPYSSLAQSSNGRSTPNTGSSVGSLSPELSCLLSPKSSLLDRGRQRTRNRPQGGIGVNKWQENGDEWVVNNDQEDESSEEEINEVLANAILKRPASLGIKRNRKDKGQESGSSGPHSPIELTFPTIADTDLMKERQRRIQQQQQAESAAGAALPSKPSSPLRKELNKASKRPVAHDEDNGAATLRICDALAFVSRKHTPDIPIFGAAVLSAETASYVEATSL